MSIDYCQLSPSLTPSSTGATHSLPSTEQYHLYSASSASSTSASLYPNLNNNLNNNNMDQSTSSNSSNSSSSSRQPPPPPPPRMSSNQSHHHNQTSNDMNNESKFKIPSSSFSTSETESTSKPVPNARNHIQPNQPVQQQQIKQEQSFKQESTEPESNRDQSEHNHNQTSCPLNHSPSDGIHTGTNSNSYSNLTSGASTPPVFRWQRDFRLLISDPEGLRLFRQYILEELGNCLIVDFYFACESIQCQENRESIPRLARAILRKFINEKTVNSLLGLSDEVKNHLVHIFPKLPKSGNPSTTESSSEEFDENFYLNLFNDAKQEVYNSLSGPYYDNFLRSDIYLRSLSEIYQTQPDGYPTVYSEAHNAEATPSPRNGPLIKSESDPDLGIHEPNIHQVESSLQVLPPTYDSITGLTYLPINSHSNSNNYPNDGFRNFGPLPTLDEVTEHDETLSNIEDDAEVSATLANQHQHQQNLENLLQNPQQNLQQNPQQNLHQQNPHQNLQENLQQNLQQNQHQHNVQQSLLQQQPSRPGTIKRTNGITSTSEYFESSSDSGYSGIEGRMSSLSLNNPRILTGSGTSRAYQRSQSPIVMMSTTGDKRPGGAVLGTVPGTAPYRYGDGGITYEQSPSHNSRMMRSYWDARKLISSGKPPPNPYHIAYSTVIPNSARDSEIQSISSNSTSDSYSALVFNNRQLRQVGSKPVGPANQRQLPRPSTGVAHPGQLSKAINALRGQQGGPEGPSGPTGPDPTQNQEQFAKLLIKKLGELIESSRMNQRLFQQMREIDSDSSSSTNVAVNPNPADMKKAIVPGQKPDFGQNLKDAFKSKRFDFGPPERETDCQSILDKHCALVFDETPTNSGTPNTAPATGQPQAPGVAPAVVPTVAAQPTVQQAVQPTSNQAPSQYLLDGANHAPRYFNNYPPNHQQQIRVPSGGGHISQVPVPYMNGHYPPPARTHLPPTSPLLHPNGHFNFMVPQNPGHHPHQHPHHHQQQVSSILVTVKFSDEDFPYKLTMVGPDVTLRAFKQSIPSKKGKFRFYFKRNSTEHEQKENHTAFMQELIEDDSAILPQCEGKIFATAHQQI